MKRKKYDSVGLYSSCTVTLNDISFSSSLSPLQNSGSCNSFYSLCHFKNVYDDYDDDDDDDELRSGFAGTDGNTHVNSLLWKPVPTISGFKGPKRPCPFPKLDPSKFQERPSGSSRMQENLLAVEVRGNLQHSQTP